MPDYQKMYLHLFNEATKAIQILQDAQQKAEEIYLDSQEVEIDLATGQQNSYEPEE